MKANISISVLLILIAVFYSFKKEFAIKENSNFLTVEDPQSKFILGAMHDARDSVYTYLSDTLNFNIWHKYTVPYSSDPNGWGWPIIGSNTTLPADQLDTPVHRYSTDIRQRISLNNSENLMTLLDRPKFEYLAFGQRSDYQCEQASKVDPDYWFYTYYNSTDNGANIKDTLDNTHGSGGCVKRCIYNRSSPGTNAQMLFDSLKGNMEQINTHWPVTWLGDQHYDWYIMPRIRIDSAFANNPANKEIEVCKIIVKNRDGDSLLQVLKVKNFKLSDTSIYSGKYIDSFYNYIDNPIVNLKILAGDWFNDNDSISFGDLHCRIDFKVFWYDKCDMWIDRIRVEDQPAHRLLTLHEQELEDWIEQEVQDIAMAEINNGNESPYKFYIEEFEMNHFPSIGYLNKKIIEYSGGRLSLMVNYNHDLVKAFIPNSWTKLFSAAQAKKYLIDSAKLREIFTECYNLEGWRDDEHGGGRESFVPNTLYNGDDYLLDDGLLVYKKSPEEYDTWIQEHFDNYEIPGLNLKHVFEFSDSISRLGDVPFQYLSQAHLWIGPGHMLKEPSNEELILTNNLAISYGAKGIMYFAWGSTNSSFDTSGVIKEVARGLINTDNSPRSLNVYGQNKWEAVKAANKKIKKWGPTIMSFDTNRKSYILRSDYANLYSQTYFADVVTYKPNGTTPSCNEDDPNSSVAGAVYECGENRYLQVATFQNSEPNTKYYMIVNRRCSPFLNDSTNSDNNGGRRFVKIKLDSGSSSFAGFNNWSIYNLENDSLIITFDKSANSYLSLGWYMPGEGKLYKIAPVMQEGGNLVTDEEVAAGTFTCKTDVSNNGKNVTINPNVTVNFANGVMWNFVGGEFICGGSTNSPLPVTLTSPASWKGISLTQCSNVEIKNTIISNTANKSTALQLIDCREFNINNNTFNLTNLDSVFAIGVDYLIPSELQAGGFCENCEQDIIYTNAVINNNEFNISNSKVPTLRLSAYSLYVVSLMADRNTFNSSSGSLAIFLSNVAAGNIKNNKIYNYKTGVNILSSASYADFYNNEISADSVGIQINNGAINLGQQAPNYTGGFNRISAGGSNANDVKTVAGHFNIDEGLNTFNINNNSTAYHLGGSFYYSFSNDGESAVENCFKFNGSESTPRENVGCTGFNCDVTFQFDPTLCAINQTDDYFVIDVLGDSSVFDTIWTIGEGGGGAISNVQLSMFNEAEIESSKDLYNSICIR